MDATVNYGVPYPECDPPLVKDSSQIAQMKALADAIDTEVERLDELSNDAIRHPAGARVITAALVNATTDTLVTPVFDQTVFENNWPAALQAGGLQVYETAWWLVGAHVSADSAAAIQVQVRLTVDGVVASSWGNPGSTYSTIFQLSSLGMVPLLINANSIIRMEIKHSTAGSPAWNYRPHLWAQKLVTP